MCNGLLQPACHFGELPGGLVGRIEGHHGTFVAFALSIFLGELVVLTILDLLRRNLCGAGVKLRHAEAVMTQDYDLDRGNIAQYLLLTRGASQL